MASQQRGGAARFQRLASKAPYFHYASHDLNLRCQKLVILVICSACLMLQKLWAFYLSTFLGDEKQALLEECVESFNKDAVENGIKTIYLRKVKLPCDTR